MAGELGRAREARALLEEAVQALREAHSLLEGSDAHFAEGVKASVRAVHRGLLGFLTWHGTWHGAPFSKEAPLPVLGRFAQQLSSMLRTPLQRARPLESLARDLARKNQLTLSEKEAARTSYYTARNLLDVVLSDLPRRVVPAETESATA